MLFNQRVTTVRKYSATALKAPNESLTTSPEYGRPQSTASAYI